MTALKIEAGTGQHIGDRKEQQDRLKIIPSTKEPGVILAVVADGMGGHTGGAMAAQQVISTAEQIFSNYSTKDESPEKMLGNIAQESHTVIKLSSFTSEQEPHSTMVVMLLQKDRADWAHVGDSRLYHFRRRQLVKRTVDHSYVEQLFAEGKITLEEMDSYPHKNILVNSLGGEFPPFVTFGSTESLTPGDCFILSSDGLWAYFSDEEMGKILAEHPPRVASEQLIAGARAQGGGRGDNCSLAIIKISHPTLGTEGVGAAPPPKPTLRMPLKAPSLKPPLKK